MTAASVHLGDGLTVSPLGFGGMALTPVYGGVDQGEALRTLHHAVDAGVSFIDTADIYGGGSNEELIAQLLKERRDEVQLATKFGLVGTPGSRLHRHPRRRAPTSNRRWKPASAAWAPTPLTCTTCTAGTSAFRLWKPWRPWRRWCSKARCGTSACRK